MAVKEPSAHRRAPAPDERGVICSFRGVSINFQAVRATANLFTEHSPCPGAGLVRQRFPGSSPVC